MNYPPIVYLLLLVTIFGWGIWGFLSKLGIGVVGTYVNMFIINLINAFTVAFLGFLFMSRGSIIFKRGLIYPTIGGIAMGVGTVAYFLLIEKYAVNIILPLTLFYLVVALAFSVIFLHEHLKSIHIIGIALMIIAAFLLSQ